VWLPLLYGLILPFRSGKSAAKYASIWTPEGSPLRLWTEKQAKLLQGWLGEQGHRVKVRYAMRYGNPSIASQLDALKAEGATRILILQAYPQYSGTTTASVIDAVNAWSSRTRNVPELRFVNRYHDDPRYIDALAKRLMDHWASHGRGEKLVMSFHGMPKRTQTLGDPYHDQCMETARRVAARADVKPENLVVTFQSRLGRAEWLQPYTEPTLVKLAKQGIRKVDVMCPGFVADNLETLEEIAQEARDAFLKAGGTEFNYVPCLNDQHEWMAALTHLALQHMQGWDTGKDTGTPQVVAAA
jgi:ferrochelatase